MADTNLVIEDVATNSIPLASANQDGLMSKTDKQILDTLNDTPLLELWKDTLTLNYGGNVEFVATEKNVILGTEKGQGYPLAIPSVTTDKAGVLTATDKKTLDNCCPIYVYSFGHDTPTPNHIEIGDSFTYYGSDSVSYLKSFLINNTKSKNLKQLNRIIFFYSNTDSTHYLTFRFREVKVNTEGNIIAVNYYAETSNVLYKIVATINTDSNSINLQLVA